MTVRSRGPAGSLPRRALRALLFAVPLLLALVFPLGSAVAGTLQVRDEAHVLSSQDVSRLRSALSQAPFDGRLLLTTNFADAQELSRYVGSLVNEPNMVVVGVDTEHHHVKVHFGTGSRVPASAWRSVERAGNDAFRAGDWEGGAAAIFREAASSVEGGGAVETAPGEARRSPSLVGPGVLLLVLGGIVGVGLLVAFATRRRNGGNVPGAGGPYGGGGYGGGPPYGNPGGYGYGAPPPQGGMGAMGGGLIGAGLGGLAGYELGKMEGEREERDRDRGGFFGGGDRGDDDRGGGGNFDAGGGGDDWDAGGGDSGGDGGGGFDGGDGGGSDF